MQHVRLFLSLLLVAGMLAYTTGAMSAQAQPKGVKPGVIQAVALNKAGTYCHLRFPAILPGTLSSSKPQLQDAKTGSIVDFYGACDHDPVGYDEVCRQRVQNAKSDFCD